MLVTIAYLSLLAIHSEATFNNVVVFKRTCSYFFVHVAVYFLFYQRVSVFVNYADSESCNINLLLSTEYKRH